MTSPILLLHTPGEPAGIGPELLIRLAQDATPHCRVAVADGEMLRSTATDLGLPLQLDAYDGQRHATAAGQLWLQHQPLSAPVAYGQPSPGNAESLLQGLRSAADLARAPHSAMITGPLNKAVINAAGIPFSGHTEFIAAHCGAGTPVMMLLAGELRVALATTHLPLRAVPDAITPAVLRHVLVVLRSALRERFRIPRPRILVCGLNPHAGEQGHLGTEDDRIIAPVLRELDPAGEELIGPLPADTIFTRERLKHCDAVLAMYHDQGLPTLKYAGFGQAVNLTLGLPIIRSSVDHGTAFDIAGQGRADPGSLRAAEALAAELAR